MIDLAKAGLVGASEEKLPDEMMDQEFLDSPIGRIMQALAGLELAAQAFESRIAQCETYLTYLLAKDPQVGAKIAAMAKTVTETKEKNPGATDGEQIEKV